MTSVLVTALYNQPEVSASNLGDYQSRYLFHYSYYEKVVVNTDESPYLVTTPKSGCANAFGYCCRLLVIFT